MTIRYCPLNFFFEHWILRIFRSSTKTTTKTNVELDIWGYLVNLDSKAMAINMMVDDQEYEELEDVVDEGNNEDKVGASGLLRHPQLLRIMR